MTIVQFTYNGKVINISIGYLIIFLSNILIIPVLTSLKTKSRIVFLLIQLIRKVMIQINIVHRTTFNLSCTTTIKSYIKINTFCNFKTIKIV